MANAVAIAAAILVALFAIGVAGVVLTRHFEITPTKHERALRNIRKLELELGVGIFKPPPAKPAPVPMGDSYADTLNTWGPVERVLIRDEHWVQLADGTWLAFESFPEQKEYPDAP